MRDDADKPSRIFFWTMAAVFAAGFTVLAVRLKEEQVDNAGKHRQEMQFQSFRRVQTAGLRGRILDRNGTVLADNRLSLDIVANPEAFKASAKGETTIGNMMKAIERASKVVGRPSNLDEKTLRRHLGRELARPVAVWRDVTEAELARFSEHSRELPGFDCTAGAERVYPCGELAAHLVGRVRRDMHRVESGDTKINFVDKDLCGREGLELQYDEYLRAMPGEEILLVDARGYAKSRKTLVEARDGFDLKLELDAELQREAERQLEGEKGALVAIDPRNGAVRALASAPAFDPNDCVPVFRKETYDRLAKDPAKPLLNRATSGTYAPGSTFKPITALAGMSTGRSPRETRICTGVYELGGMKIKCGRTWGHGDVDMIRALRESCNPYFCALGVATGTNALCRMAKTFGLGARTGIDFPTDAAGLVPDASAKARLDPGSRWRLGDLAQMSMGQGMLLVTPLQMARLAGALGTGSLFVPRLNSALPLKACACPSPNTIFLS